MPRAHWHNPWQSLAVPSTQFAINRPGYPRLYFKDLSHSFLVIVLPRSSLRDHVFQGFRYRRPALVRLHGTSRTDKRD